MGYALPAIIAIIGLVSSQTTQADPATQPSASASGDAFSLYEQAADSITIDSPAATVNIYPNYAPSSSDWQRLAAASWNADQTLRDLSHRAASAPPANVTPEKLSASYNKFRMLAIHLSDGALFAHTQGNDALAISEIRDLFRMAELFEAQPSKSYTPFLVAQGFRALAYYQLLVITSGVILTDDPANKADLNVDSARELVTRLVKQPNGLQILVTIDARLTFSERDALKTRRVNVANVAKRIDAERGCAAVSLACHLYKFKLGIWPDSLGLIVPDYLAEFPLDPFATGKTIGYVLIKGGLPDGSDRPLVYFRADSRDGLAFRLDGPQWGFYAGDGSNAPVSQQKHYGQFRDIARWEQSPNYAGQPNQPLLQP
jgi:hypothetical protein